MSKNIICEEHIDEIVHEMGHALDQYGAIVDTEALCDINDVVSSVLMGTGDDQGIKLGILDGDADKLIDDLCYAASNILRKYDIELSQETMESLNDALTMALVV